jgi:hypothetical protein
MIFHVEEAEYIGLLRIKSVVEAALRSRDHCISEAGYAKMFELIQREIEAYYQANNLPVPDFSIKKSASFETGRGDKMPFPIEEG